MFKLNPYFLIGIIVAASMLLNHDSLAFKRNSKGHARIVAASELNIQIMGSIITRNPATNVVLIKFIESKKVKAFRRGNQILDKYTISSIYDNYINLKHNSQIIKVLKKGFAGSSNSRQRTLSRSIPVNSNYKEDGFERTGNKVAITEAYRDNLIKNQLAKILMHASAEPAIEDGSIIGFRFDQIVSGSIFEKMGIQNGDVITEINDYPLDDVTATVKLLHKLKSQDRFKVRYKRRGQESTLDVNIQ